MQTFYFNTGVKPWNTNAKDALFIKDEMNIPFDCEDVPEGASFAFACDDPNLYPESNYIVRHMFNTTMLSKYAYFNPPNKL